MPRSADRSVYLDASALVKLVIREPESEALRRYLRRKLRRTSSALARVEVVRAARPHGRAAVARARRLVARLDLVRVEDPVLDAAALLRPSLLRSLDAIHLASAQTLKAELEAIVTYDDRLSAAARDLGMPIERPT